MAPDAPGNLEVLDLRFRDKTLTGSIEGVAPPQSGSAVGWLQARFDAPTKEPGFVAMGGGVVWVRAPQGYVFSPRESAGEISHAESEYFFNNVAMNDGLMLVLILPKGYTLADSEPVPRNARVFKGRIAVYFKPPGSYGDDTRTSWRMKKLEGELKAEVERLRTQILRHGKTTANMGVLVDDEDPAKKAPVRVQIKPRAEMQPSGRGYAIWLIAGIGLLVFYIYRVGTLPPGAQNQVYYVVLLLAAVACSIALFSGLGSTATITYHRHGIALKLGGAAALFALIVYGGFKLVPSGPDTFDLTLRAHSADGRDPIITSGKVTIDLDNDRRTEAFGPNGEADFKGIPARFMGADVKMLPQVEGYEAAWQRHKVQWTAFDLPLVRAAPPVTTLTGSIIVTAGQAKSLRVLVDGQKDEATPDDRGRFELPVKGKDGERVRVKIYSGPDLLYDDYQTLPGPVTLSIRKPR